MKTALLDGDLILKLIFCDDIFSKDAAKLWDFFGDHYKKKFKIYLTEIDRDKIAFYLKQYGDSKKAKDILYYLEIGFEICSVNKAILEKAVFYQGISFEQSVKLACATSYNLDFIITQNSAICKFLTPNKDKEVEIVTPRGFLLTYTNSDEFKGKMDNQVSSSIKISDWHIKNFEVICGNDQSHPKATVWLENAGKEEHEQAWGNGPVDAVYKAIYKVMSHHVSIPVHSLERIYAVSEPKGTDATVTTAILVECKNEIFTGWGSDTDLVRAAVYAYVSVLNKIIDDQSLLDL